MGGHPTPRTGRTAVSTFYWSAKTFAVAPATRLLFRPLVKGLGNVPAEGAAILASNHLSVSDSVFMPAMLERQVHFLAKKEYFTGAGPKGWITRKFFEATNQLPMDRSGGRPPCARSTPASRRCARGACSASTPRARAAPTAACTAARSAWPSSRWPPAPPWCPSP